MVNPADPGVPWWQVILGGSRPGRDEPETEPLPELEVGGISGDDGRTMSDESGAMFFDTSQNSLLSAIYALAKEIRIMSETFGAHFDGLIASLKQANEDQAAAIVVIHDGQAAAIAQIATLTAEIEALRAGVPPVVGNVVTDAQVAALQTEILATATNAIHTQGLVAPPVVTPPPAPPVDDTPPPAA